MKTPEEMAKFRIDVLEQLVTATSENVRFLQGVIYGLDWLKGEEKQE